MKLEYREKLKCLIGKYYRNDTAIYKIVGYHEIPYQDGFYFDIKYGKMKFRSKLHYIDEIDDLINSSDISDKIVNLLHGTDLLKDNYSWFKSITLIKHNEY